MENPHSSRHIEVDGISYNIATGKAVAQTNPNRRVVSDIKPPQGGAAHSAVRQQTIFQAPVQKQPTPHTPKKNITQHKKKSLRNKEEFKTLKKSIPQTNYFADVIINSFRPLGGAMSWQLSLLRSLFAPQNWFLALLPLLLLQIKLFVNDTPNTYLHSLKASIDGIQYQQWIITFSTILTVFLFGILIRSLTTAIGMHLRIRKIDNKQTSFAASFRVAAHNSLRQSYNYVWHLFAVVIVSLCFIAIGAFVLHSNSTLIDAVQTRLVSILIVVWAVVLVIMYAKHWLQIGLLAYGPHTHKIQRYSYKLLFSLPLQNFISGFISTCLVVGVIIYAIWIAVLQQNYVLQTNAHSFHIGWLILATASIFLISTVIGYFQQNLWARHTSYALTRKPQYARQILADNYNAKASIAPLFWCIYGIIMIVCVAVLGALYFAPQLQSTQQSLQKHIPNTISPLQKNK